MVDEPNLGTPHESIEPDSIPPCGVTFRTNWIWLNTAMEAAGIEPAFRFLCGEAGETSVDGGGR